MCSVEKLVLLRRLALDPVLTLYERPCRKVNEISAGTTKLLCKHSYDLAGT